MPNSPSQPQRVSAGTSTIVTTQNGDNRSRRAEGPTVQTLRLRVRPKRRVEWTSDVVDNEAMNKKSSKICCQFHKTRPFGESSSDSSSGSDEDDGDSDDDKDTKLPGSAKRKRPQPRKCANIDGCSDTNG
eukprot:Gregarina_sp_Poly_1__10095@NODE_684_length_6787_cov_55_603423_g510_i1_p2_GENE_NODE_684_length_6787_cov_55_603423_g510_i1NODE_684_length_6787_cov_55_603423_g510_i1_p2_ORF_typecomplete_len130_score14_49PPI_Ypi1/PF07491_11/3_3e23GEN1_C/PF18380_1/0_088_NODE_684_length_6787_cov_55_603423_g510_i162966685